MLASSSSDDDNDGNASPSSAMSQLNDRTLTIEKHKIRDTLSLPSLSETSWGSIVQNGFMQLSHHHRQLLRHIARYSTASKCTLYCIVGDKDVHRKQVKYFTVVVCTPLTLLQDIENGTVEVYKVLYLRTLTITVDTFLCCELARFVNEHPTPIVSYPGCPRFYALLAERRVSMAERRNSGCAQRVIPARPRRGLRGIRGVPVGGGHRISQGDPRGARRPSILPGARARARRKTNQAACHARR